MIFYSMVFTAAFHLYLCWKLRAAFGSGRWILFFWGGFALISAFLAARYYEFLGDGRFFEVFFALAFTEFVVAGMLCVVFVLTEIFRGLLFLWDKAAKTHVESLVTPRRTAVFSLVFVFCAVVYGYYEAWNVREVRVVVPTGKLPLGTGRLRIVQLSDVHIGGLYPIRHLEQVMEMVRAAEPDIFVITGDLADGDMTDRRREAALLAGHGARHGAFAVVGNHEYYVGLEQSMAFMERAGLTVLYDQAAEAAGIAIFGLDDLTTVWPVSLRAAGGRFTLLLKHRPQVLKTSRGKFDLQLCGHTHGGQLWPVGPLQEKLQGFVQGLSKDGEHFVYVSNGTGYWAVPLRIFAPPEVTVIDLVPAL